MYRSIPLPFFFGSLRWSLSWNCLEVENINKTCPVEVLLLLLRALL
jgi:hypothetical protein